MAISKIGSKALVDCSVAAVDIEDGSITSAKLAGSIANAKLANSSITVNGTSVSLGASGSIPAVSWQSVITADGSTGTTAVAGNGYFIDTTSAAHTITLPSSPSIGDTVAIKDYAGTFGTNNLTIARNSSNIQGVANDSLITTNRASLTLVYVDSTKGWLYAVESNVADLGKPIPAFTAATGGTVTTSGDYKIHTFTGDGCFAVSTVGNSPTVPTGGPNVVDYLVVAGGGGSISGGAGAGGFRLSNSTCMPAPLTSPLATPTGITVSAISYPITVGSGGTGTGSPGNISQATNGSPSVFSTITSAGGGFGQNNDAGGNGGGNGGSGGGGGRTSTSTSPGGSGNTPPTSPSQGNNGGTAGTTANYFGGGGGGAGASGTSTPGSTPAPGGIGSYVLSTGFAGCNGTPGPVGSTRYFAGGGGGGNGSTSPGGAGGGGDGSPSGNAGTANTGGGAGGSGGSASGLNGGKGIVIIRYKYQ